MDGFAWLRHPECLQKSTDFVQNSQISPSREVLSMGLRRTEVDENGISGAGGRRLVQHWTLIPRKCLV
jgi:hypothetical protein